MKDAPDNSLETGEHHPKVSVVMAIRNEEEHGPAAIQSILDQTFTDFEFIIIDDASTDSTPQMLRDYAERDKRIRILTNTENISVPRSLNAGLEAARGEYIARMDGDDICLPHRFMEQVKFLDDNSDFVLVGGGAEFINATGDITGTFAAGSKSWEFGWVSNFRPPLVHSSALYRAELISIKNERYSHDFNRAEDFEFWHRILRHGKGCELAGVFIQYRVHNANVSTIHAQKQREVANHASQENARKLFPEIPEENRQALFNFLRSDNAPPSTEINTVIATIGKMQSIYADRNRLSSEQIRAIRRRTAKLLMRRLIEKKNYRRSGNVPAILKLVAQYFPEYCTDSAELIRRRVGMRRAA